MEAPHAPIIVLQKPDDKVSAYFTTQEAVAHFDNQNKFLEHHLGSLAELEFFDARGRRLEPSVGPEGSVTGLGVASEESHAESVRDRVRRRSQDARQKLEAEKGGFESVDESPLTLAEGEDSFEVFTWRLASVLRPEGSSSDPVPKAGTKGAGRNVGGWWHNTFAH